MFTFYSTDFRVSLLIFHALFLTAINCGILVFSLNACFHVQPSDFMKSIQGQTCHGCINHDVVVGLCSELLMWLYFYIHLGFSKSFWITWISGQTWWISQQKDDSFWNFFCCFFMLENPTNLSGNPTKKFYSTSLSIVRQGKQILCTYA